MLNYLATVNEALARELGAHSETVVFGENIDKGSCLCGVARGLPGRVVNVGNCENTHVGAGFGLLLNGLNAVLIVKQLDFLLLALDPMVNSWNLIRTAYPAGSLGSFSIVVIVCDQGWQGPQSSFHGFSDICSMARVDGYTLNTRAETEAVIGAKLLAPGFRLIGLSQRAFGRQMNGREAMSTSRDLGVFQYSAGRDATIVGLNFALERAFSLEEHMARQGLKAGVFSAHPGPARDWDLVSSHAATSGRLLITDDGKGLNSFANLLAMEALKKNPRCRVSVETREEAVDWSVGADECAFEADRSLAALLT